MGQKIDPRSLRMAVNKNWQSVWHDDRRYAELLQEDLKIRQFIQKQLKHAGVAEVRIERSINDTQVEITVAKPGLVIGRGGSGIEQLTQNLKKMVTGKLKVTVVEKKKPNLSAKLLAENIAYQLERRYPFRRAMTQALEKAREAGAKGIKLALSGRLGGVRIARTEKMVEGSVPTSTLKAMLDFARATAYTKYGTVGIKVWVYLGENSPA